MADIPIYRNRGMGFPQHVGGIDVSPLINSLARFQQYAEQAREKDIAQQAQLAGAKAGAELAEERQPINIDNVDNTIAGEQFKKAAVISYLSRLELDAKEEAEDLKRRWFDPNAFGRNDYASFAQVLETKKQEYLKNLQGSMRDVYAPRIDGIFQSVHDAVAEDYQKAVKDRALADLVRALEADEQDAKRAVRNLEDDPEVLVDPETGEVTFASFLTWKDKVQQAVDSGLISASTAMKWESDFKKSLLIEHFKGDFESQPLSEKRGYIEAFKANKDLPIDPEQKEELARWMEVKYEREKNKEAESLAYDIYSQASAVGVTEAEKREHAYAQIEEMAADGTITEPGTMRRLVDQLFDQDRAVQEIRKQELINSALVKAMDGEDLTPEEEAAVRKEPSVYARVKEYRLLGGPAFTDWNMYIEWLSLPPEEKTLDNLAKYRPHLTPQVFATEINKIYAREAAATKTTGVKAPKVSVPSLVENIIATHTGKPKKEWDEEEYLMYSAMENLLLKDVADNPSLATDFRGLQQLALNYFDPMVLTDDEDMIPIAQIAAYPEEEFEVYTDTGETVDLKGRVIVDLIDALKRRGVPINSKTIAMAVSNYLRTTGVR